MPLQRRRRSTNRRFAYKAGTGSFSYFKHTTGRVEARDIASYIKALVCEFGKCTA